MGLQGGLRLLQHAVEKLLRLLQRLPVPRFQPRHRLAVLRSQCVRLDRRRPAAGQEGRGGG